jgi:hypothetical protein
MGPTQQHGTRLARRTVLWSISLIILALVFVVAWIGSRALMARDELLGAIPLANQIGTEALAEEGIAPADIDELQQRAASAARLTSDPIWRAVEWVPVLGNNLTAFRESASMIDDLATEALPPLEELSGQLTLDSLSPTGGAFNLETFLGAQPFISEALAALDSANATAATISTEDTIPQIGIAVDEVIGLVGEARVAVQNVDTAVTLLPTMLGSDGPREYLLMSLNNAELRATGGIAGALAILKVDQGRIELGALSNANAIGEFDAPVLALSEAERTLYGDQLGTYMQDVNYTPDFARSAALAQRMWAQRTGDEVDGVIAIDPVALGYILRATGPVDVGSGLSLTSDNAKDLLLSGVYSSFVRPADQDKFFASAMSRVFEALVGGSASGETIIDSLGQGVQENRIHLWSSDPMEQEILRTTPLAGLVPTSTDRSTAFGVYFNDATGAKMDYYLSSGIGIASAVCRNDGRPNFEVKIKLESRAPLDAASSLPTYVTGTGFYGVTPGNISTNVFVYAPEGSVPYSVTIDGQEYAFVAAAEGDHSVAGVTVELLPGQQSEVTMKFLGLAGASDVVELQHTPMATDVLTSIDKYLDCDNVAPAPVEGDEEQSGALSVLRQPGTTLDAHVG